ncbi:hypothetical protein GCM10010124_35130 [Pilimelia terevasa]|uniref:Secreted protein n=1 Tax=Pilimelia terevasa TaxID=53372 RepID=A0A8J3FJE3_9ACTN|nr:hypothetical protein [Pilimelia terevasa]GGK39383.1 hypothetical protein GCM10010124_35130 [Pilimelia terevasa]
MTTLPRPASRRLAWCAAAALVPSIIASPASAAPRAAGWVSVSLPAIDGLCATSGSARVQVASSTEVRLLTPGFTTSNGQSVACEATIEFRMQAHKRLVLRELHPAAEVIVSGKAGAITNAAVRTPSGAEVGTGNVTWQGDIHQVWGPPVDGRGTELAPCGGRGRFTLTTELQTWIPTGQPGNAMLNSGTSATLAPSVVIDAPDC